MPEQSGHAKDGWVSRYRHRRAERHARRVDRRARRRAHSGGGPDDAARQAESGTFQSGGFFTTKSGPKP
jgi:hypothetical protein